MKHTAVKNTRRYDLGNDRLKMVLFCEARKRQYQEQKDSLEYFRWHSVMAAILNKQTHVQITESQPALRQHIKA